MLTPKILKSLYQDICAKKGVDNSSTHESLDIANGYTDLVVEC